MPLFGDAPDTGAAQWEPQAADSRLASTAGAAPGGVFTSDLSGTCVYHIAHQSMMQAMRQSGQNQEIALFTQGVYEARELALSRMQLEPAAASASGIAGVTVDVSSYVWGVHATEFFATGTAIRRLGADHRLPDSSPRPTFTLTLDQ